MMRFRGGFFCILLIWFLVCSGTVMATPPHKWFDDAVDDYRSVNGFVYSGISGCRDALNWSLAVNCFIDFNTSLHIVYNEEALDAADTSANFVGKILFFSLDDISAIDHIAGSFPYVAEMIVPMETMVGNISGFVAQHRFIVEGFNRLVESFSYGTNGSSSQEQLAEIRSAIGLCRQQLNTAEVVLRMDPWMISDEQLSMSIQMIEQVLDRYESYIELFAGFFPDEKPLITLFSDKNKVFLGEEFLLYGYCMAGSRFIANQTVDLYRNNIKFATIKADDSGRFDYMIPVPIVYGYGGYEFMAGMRISGTYYYSKIVKIQILRIPTQVSLQLNPHHVYLNESCTIAGMVSDYHEQGVSTSLQLNVGKYVFSLRSDEDGVFSYRYLVNVSFGSYMVYCLVPDTELYQGSVSETEVLYIDTPTILSLVSTEDRVTIGDDVVVLGNLRSQIDGSPVVNASVDIYLGNTQIGIVQTSAFGSYDYVYNTDGMGAGSYEVHARFRSTNLRWRGSQSDDVSIALSVSFWAYLPIVIIIITVIIAFSIIWLFRERLVAWMGQSQPSLVLDQECGSPGRSRIRFSQRISRTVHRIHRGAQLTQDAIQDAVFAQYKMLLRFLSTEGIPITSTDTHLDVQSHMMHQGFSVKDVQIITETFEQAMYAPSPVTYDQLLTFDHSIFIVMTHGGD
ncbi:MAG: hypothetical protein KKC68_08890 [Candidatus Thermoplasmatota archaeon]|nr:hypothetical protein [Candidatus Thermoplasmatota archaeon]MBU1941876.1 hypothetical protein [Candidatus Thermoplasmatota archaeon]